MEVYHVLLRGSFDPVVRVFLHQQSRAREDLWLSYSTHQPLHHPVFILTVYSCGAGCL
jgi:hypothetical protein